MSVQMIHGDCREVLASMEEASVDAVVTDPPYGLGFMSKAWDRQDLAFDPGTWVEVLRVLKPGGHLVAFGGTRTHHRLWCAAEDAGFEIRDTILCAGLAAWVFGSGFPKGLDVSKAIDKAAGAERERVLAYPSSVVGHCFSRDPWTINNRGVHIVDTPQTNTATVWLGWNVALKPAHEPILLARKPLSEPNVAANVLRWGTGGLNVHACRVAGDENGSRNRPPSRLGSGTTYAQNEWTKNTVVERNDTTRLGRWPTNLLLVHSPFCVRGGERQVESNDHFPKSRPAGGIGNDGHAGQSDLQERQMKGETVTTYHCTLGCAVRMLDEQSGDRGAAAPVRGTEPSECHSGVSAGPRGRVAGPFHDDRGGASRFFPQFTYELGDFAPFLYEPKSSRRERGEGNTHPTVKPVAVLRWLMKLVTPPRGTVLDCFAGSGTGAIAADREGFGFIGIEAEAAYIEIARARWQQDAPLFNREPAA
jgi:site-specific DNA-methyltransferase (adenine-specific)